MINYIKYILLFATFAAAEKQIKLEDIERDNLLSERRVNRDEETVKSGESQHLLAPIYVGPTNEVLCASSKNYLLYFSKILMNSVYIYRYNI